LPPGTETNNRFRRVFIPTYERWVGTRANPWVIPDHVAIPVLQTIWDAVYMADGVEWTFKANDPVFLCVCTQTHSLSGTTYCLPVLHRSTNSTAEIMVEEFFEFSGESLESLDGRQEWATGMLDSFKSPFIVRVFAAHLVRLAGAIDTDLDVEGFSSTQKYPSRGALALATATVERVLQLWANGEMGPPLKTYMKAAPRLNPANGDIFTFSADVWAAPTTNYYKSITQMKPSSLEAIVEAANTFL
ncbi:hypothetical protein H4582DRAFT_1788806, partial [Lactarius indigo]